MRPAEARSRLHFAVAWVRLASVTASRSYWRFVRNTPPLTWSGAVDRAATPRDLGRRVSRVLRAVNASGGFVPVRFRFASTEFLLA